MIQTENQTVTEFIKELNKIIKISDLNKEQAAEKVLDKLSTSLKSEDDKKMIIKLRQKHYQEKSNIEILTIAKKKMDLADQ